MCLLVCIPDSPEELACDGIDEEPETCILGGGWDLLASVKKSVIGFPLVVVLFFFAIISKTNSRK